MNEMKVIKTILEKSKTIAVVGLSDKPFRDSYQVASYMEEAGYKIIPVNPMINEWNGKKPYPDLKSIPERIDIVDIFRRSEFVDGIVDQAIGIGAKSIWMQLGVIDELAAKKAIDAGILVVMNKCIKIEHHNFRK